jgi:4-amino-4-deoxy-L-arabinose transferase-like glycosyltransferase
MGRVRVALLAAGVTVTSAIVLFTSAETRQLHVDESGWVASGIYYSGLVLDGDLSWDHWRCSPCEPWGSLNPQLGKLMIGLPLRAYWSAFPSQREQPSDHDYAFGQSVEQNIAERRVPPHDTLTIARRASAVIGILCCLLVFGIGYVCDSWLTAIVAAVLLLSNQLFIDNASRAMTDVHYSVFLLALCFVSIALLRTRDTQRVRYVSALCGLLAGLSCSVKITGIVVGSAYFVVVAACKYLTGDIRKPWFISSVLLFAVCSTLTIYALNPFYWPGAAATDVKAVLAEGSALLSAVVHRTFDGATVEQSFPHLFRLSTFPALFLRWNRFMTNQLAQGEPVWRMNGLSEIHNALFAEHISVRAELIFLLIGIAICVFKLWNTSRERCVHECAAPLIYFGVNYVFILCFLKVNFDRYYLPTIIAGRVLVAMGIAAAITGVMLLASRIARRLQ